MHHEQHLGEAGRCEIRRVARRVISRRFYTASTDDGSSSDSDTNPPPSIPRLSRCGDRAHVDFLKVDVDLKGQYWSGFSRYRQFQRVARTRLCGPGYGLSSAPSRGSRTRDGAELATSKAPTAAALSPLHSFSPPPRPPIATAEGSTAGAYQAKETVSRCDLLARTPFALQQTPRIT